MGSSSGPGVFFVQPLLATPPPLFARRSASAVTWGHQIFLFGGVGTRGTEGILDVTDELWIFDTRSLEWMQVPRAVSWPSVRRCVGFANFEESLWLFGGSGVRANEDKERHTFLNDLWTYRPDIGQWKSLHTSDNHWEVPCGEGKNHPRPLPRYTPVFWGVGTTLVVFGGYTEDRLGPRKLNDLWLYRDGRWRSVQEQTPAGYHAGVRWPGVRYGSMSSAGDQAVYLCGGFSDAGDHIDLWRFDLGREEWSLLSADARSSQVPAPRYCSAMAKYQDRLYLFGGRSRSNPKLNFNDLWAFDLKAGTWQQIHDNRVPHRYDRDAEFPAYHAKSSVSVVGEYWYIWGGEGHHGHVSDLWRFDFSRAAWEFVQPARPDDPLFW